MSYQLTPIDDLEQSPESLSLYGVRENNLKNLTLDIAHNSLTVISGVSGSGKSSLAFDTIYAEGGRRYIETFSPYTRQFLDRLHRPVLDNITGVRPALALEQRNRITSSRSTVGTVTEINDYLKLIWANLAELQCPQCFAPVKQDTPFQVINTIIAECQRGNVRLLVTLFPVDISGKASSASLGSMLEAQGFTRWYCEQSKQLKSLQDLPNQRSSKQKLARLLVVVDRLPLDSESLTQQNMSVFKERIASSIEQAYSCGKGKMAVIFFTSAEGKDTPKVSYFSEHLHCADCSISFPKAKQYLFSFNSPLGACPCCKGFGKLLLPSPELCVPNPKLSINQGALACWRSQTARHELRKLREFCRANKIPLDIPWEELSLSLQKLIFVGNGAKTGFKGLNHWFERLQTKRHKVHVRVFLARYRSEVECPQCSGTRLVKEASWYKLNGLTISQFWHLSLEQALQFCRSLVASDGHHQPLQIALEEVISRLSYLIEIGLGYLTLDRQSRTLSGGESQRVGLTALLGARLVHTTLVLDEPTIGLHPSDTQRLITVLKELKNRGNTLVLVEHDLDVIKAADTVIDLGPNAGSAGGEVVFKGPLSKMLSCRESLTAEYLSGRKKCLREVGSAKKSGARMTNGAIKICGARANNLKDIDLTIPLGKLVIISGISGSGKSTVVTDCLFQPYQRLKQGTSIESIATSSNSPVRNIQGLDQIDDLLLVDQSPIGKTPRSNPATYTKCWEVIRQCFAETEQAQSLGLSKSAFSFNVDGGRCPVCKGAGALRIEMQFLADVFVPCESCGGSRFQDKVLGVHFSGKTILDFLEMSIAETLNFFKSVGAESKFIQLDPLLQPLIDLGLGYLRLGHPLNALSGGEAQRLKLASYLSPSVKERCLFILDEPTTGLHPHNIQGLLAVFDQLLQRGHSILCIEHNLEVIAQADWLIDLGPGGGDNGGEIIVAGAPKELLKRANNLKRSKTLELLSCSQGQFLSRPEKNSPVALPLIPAVSVGKKKRSSAIEVIGARHHNLKNVSVKVLHNKLSVITGVSGSGKSTLAFDLIFAEGQRRYIDCLSPYARQYMKQLSRPEVDLVDSLPPTIAVSQKTAPPLGISTIATTTEIYQFLRLLYAKLGVQYCPDDGTKITSLGKDSIISEIHRRFMGKRVFLFAPVISGRKGSYQELFQRALKADIHQARIDGKIFGLTDELKLERHKLHWISLLIGSLTLSKNNEAMLAEAVEQCFLLGDGSVEVSSTMPNGDPELFSLSRTCPTCGKGYRELDPQDFSFRSARGVCKVCNGRGRISKTKKDEGELVLCPGCAGARIGPIGCNVKLGEKAIYELTSLTAPVLLDFLTNLSFSSRVESIVQPILSELQSRLSIISSVGLDYLELDRDAASISGGEAQRLRLARCLGSPLSGVCYILDEPSIGLHPQDQKLLMNTLFELRDKGNTVIVVEHDEDIIRSADYVIDVGPEGGKGGGRILTAGTLNELQSCEESLTAAALKARRNNGQFSGSQPGKDKKGTALSLINASANNLKHLNVTFPKEKLTVVAGVSGAGKSSLVHECLVRAVSQALEKDRKKVRAKNDTAVEDLVGIERLVEIDQSPLGRTSTSTPASFLGIFDEIRKVYALLPEAKARGWKASYFSFNTGAGRCKECQGRGTIKVPMSFLPDAHSICEACNGLRYQEQTLEAVFQGVSIGELLNMTLSEAWELFAQHPKIRRPLEYVIELGLGYVTLGQTSSTLSGGEAQRLKIARELGLREAVNTLYIFDEPTIGLHMTDVDKLLAVMRKLIELGNTVVVIEHNLDIIRAADWLIELGPQAGDKGGKLLFQGHPQELVARSVDTPTRRFLDTASSRSAGRRKAREEAL